MPWADMPWWLAPIVGVVLLLVAVITIYHDRQISAGQSVLLALGALLIALPQISTFEYGDGALKVVTREQAIGITEELKAANERQLQLIGGINSKTEKIGAVLTAMDARVSAVENALRRQPGIDLPSHPKITPGAIKDLRYQNDKLGKDAEQSIKRLDRIRKELSAPAQ
jgi:hypothetical protein